MHCIDTQRPEIDPASNRIHIRTIHVDKSAYCVNFISNLLKGCFKNTAGVRVGNHHTGDTIAIFFDTAVEVFIQYTPLGICIEINDLTLLTSKTSHSRSGKIGAVGRTRD